MNDEGKVFIVGLFVGVALGVILAGAVLTDLWRKESIGRGYAQYDPKTAQWGWIVKDKEKQ